MSLKYVYRKKLLSFDLSKIPVFDKKNHNVTPIDFMAIISSTVVKFRILVDVTLLITCITMHKVSLPMNLKKEFLSF